MPVPKRCTATCCGRCTSTTDFAEGETEFLFQQRKVKPRTGSLLIAPTAFTHTHRGNRPQGGDKFIATSWILFQPAEKLYAPAK